MEISLHTQRENAVFVVNILLQFVKNFLRQLYKNYIWLEREFYGEEHATIPRSIGILVLALETSECEWVGFFFSPINHYIYPI